MRIFNAGSDSFKRLAVEVDAFFISALRVDGLEGCYLPRLRDKALSFHEATLPEQTCGPGIAPRGHTCRTIYDRRPGRSQHAGRQTMRNIFRPYGPRGYAMLSLSLVAIFRAIDYLKPAQPGYTPSALRELAAIIPTPVWGVLWGITGVWVLVAAFRERQAIALALLAGMSFLWAIIYVVTAAFRGASPDATTAWLSALGFVAFAVIVVALAKMINPARIREVTDA